VPVKAIEATNFICLHALLDRLTFQSPAVHSS
jgi:hypothetical protein